MLKPDKDNIQRFISTMFQKSTVFLVGSVARGVEDVWSDTDFIVVTPDVKGQNTSHHRCGSLVADVTELSAAVLLAELGLSKPYNNNWLVNALQKSHVVQDIPGCAEMIQKAVGQRIEDGPPQVSATSRANTLHNLTRRTFSTEKWVRRAPLSSDNLLIAESRCTSFMVELLYSHMYLMGQWTDNLAMTILVARRADPDFGNMWDEYVNANTLEHRLTIAKHALTYVVARNKTEYGSH